MKNTCNPYRELAAGYSTLIRSGRTLPLGGMDPLPRVALPENARRVLLFSPHPDDECITGGLPLRLLRECAMEVMNVAVTLGSRRDRQQPRWQELTHACDYLGFGLVATGEHGLEQIKQATRDHDRDTWSAAVEVIRRTLVEYSPSVIFCPHHNDWNSTHIGTHYLVMDALNAMTDDFTCLVIETEFWGAMATPNLMIESTPEDVGDLMAAISFHVGEVERNPYHLSLPAWMQDNVRRGGEIVGGQGGTAPDFLFSTLYRIRHWQDHALHSIDLPQRVFSAGENLQALLS